MRPSVRLADRHGDRRAGGLDLQAALQAFGNAHRDRAHDAVAELLLHFERQLDVLELERLVDLRDLLARKFHVDDRADDLDNLAGLLICSLLDCCRSSDIPLASVAVAASAQTAAAPPTISLISFVIAAWRALL